MSSAAVIAVRVTPRSSRNAIEGIDESGELRVRVTAPPADGAANAAVEKLLAKAVGVPRSAVQVISGTTGRRKRLRIQGIRGPEISERWPGLDVHER